LVEVLLQRLLDAKPAVVAVASKACAAILTATADGGLVQQLLLAHHHHQQQQLQQQQPESVPGATRDVAVTASRDCSGLLEVVQLVSCPGTDCMLLFVHVVCFFFVSLLLFVVRHKHLLLVQPGDSR
jgi:hypothetical protein